MKKLIIKSYYSCILKFVFSCCYFIIIAFLVSQILRPSKIVEATSYLKIPTINLSTPVSTVHLHGSELSTPEEIAGVYFANPNKIFILGHVSTVFKNLSKITSESSFEFDGKKYQIKETFILEKSKIDMKNILKPEYSPTVIIMTCHGTPLGNQDYTHRFIATAIEISH